MFKKFSGGLLIFVGVVGITVAISFALGFVTAGTIFKIPYAIVGDARQVLVEWVRSPPEAGGALEAHLQEDNQAWGVVYGSGPCLGALGRTPPDKRWFGVGFHQFEGLPGTDVTSSVYTRVEIPTYVLAVIFSTGTFAGLWLLGFLSRRGKREGFDVLSTPVA